VVCSQESSALEWRLQNLRNTLLLIYREILSKMRAVRTRIDF
jgi:hypothetical protein